MKKNDSSYIATLSKSSLVENNLLGGKSTPVVRYFSGKLYIEKIEENSTYDLILTNIKGREIFKKENLNTNELNLDNNLLNGIYFTTIKTNKSSFTQKILINDN